MKWIDRWHSIPRSVAWGMIILLAGSVVLGAVWKFGGDSMLGYLSAMLGLFGLLLPFCVSTGGATVGGVVAACRLAIGPGCLGLLRQVGEHVQGC